MGTNRGGFIVKKIIEIIKKGVKEDDTAIEYFNKLEKALTAFNDKPYSKHMANAVQKIMPECQVSWDNRFGMYHIVVKKEGISWSNKLDFLIGYQTERNPFHIDGFNDNKSLKEKNTCYYEGAIARNNNREKLLSDNDRLKIIEGHLTMLSEASKILRNIDTELFNSFDVEDYYNLKKLYNVAELKKEQ